jgi:hypothetical protein
VQDHRESIAQLAEQPGWVETHWVGDDLDDPEVAHLETVTEGTMDHVSAPMLFHAINVGQLVDQPGRGEHPASNHDMTIVDLDPEVVILGASHIDSAPLEDLYAIAPHLVATDGRELRRGQTLVPEIAVHVGGGGVSRLTGVDNDDRTTLATELEGGSEARRRPADDDDVAVSLHRLVFMSTHGPEDTAVLRLCKPTCYIRKVMYHHV